MGFRLTDDETRSMLAEAHEGVLTTLRADGRPVSLPVWHVVLDRTLYVSTPSGSKKVTRVRNDPRGSFTVSSGTAWPELRAVVAEVEISVVDDDELVAEVGAAIEEKYAGLTPPRDRLPAAVAAVYDDMVVLRLDVVGRPLTWNNAALLGS